MAHTDVYKAVSSVVKCFHMDWRTAEDKKDPPPLPWAVYYGEEHPIAADDEQVAHRTDWTVELYERRRDKALEKGLGEAIKAKFGTYTRNESWVASENCLLVTFDFHEIEGETND